MIASQLKSYLSIDGRFEPVSALYHTETALLIDINDLNSASLKYLLFWTLEQTLTQ